MRVHEILKKKFYFAFENCVTHFFLWILIQAIFLSSTNCFHLEEAKLWFWLAILKRDAAQFATCPPSIAKKFDPKFKCCALPFAYTSPLYTKNPVYPPSFPFPTPLPHIWTRVHIRTISLFLIIIIRSLDAKANVIFCQKLLPFNPWMKISNLIIEI